MPYMGEDYLLEVKIYQSYKKPGVMQNDRRFLVLTAQKDQEVIENALKAWYMERAKEIISERVSFYQNQIGEKVSSIRIKDVRSRWGSCSSKRNLNFNWRLVMAPLPVLDYVVVHELCHLKEMNHSKEFWKLVREVLPDYQQQREWLKTCRLIEDY